MLTIEFNLTEEDLFNFSYLHWNSPGNSSHKFRYFFKSFIFSCFGASVLILFKVMYGDRVTMQDLLIVLSFGFLSAIIFTFLLIKRSLQRQVAKIAADPGNANMFYKTELLINSSGIVSTDVVSKLSYKWNAITKSRETKNYYLLYTNSIQAIIIPKKVLGNDELKTLKQILTENINLSVQLNEA